MRNEPNRQLRSAVRAFYGWLGSVVVLGVAPIVAQKLLHRGTPGARVAAVVIGVAGVVPWLAALFLTIRRGDEFVRRMHLIACTLAFAGAWLLMSTLDWLVRADVIGPPDLRLVWVAFPILWLIALVATKLHFERAA